MATYRIELRPSAGRELTKLRRADQTRIIRAIDGLGDKPRPPGVKKLTGMDELYRIRVGDYRVVYQIQDKALLVLVVRVGHRRDVYHS